MSELVFRGGTILTIDAQHHVLAGDVAIVDGAIVQVGGDYAAQRGDYEIVDCSGCVIMPVLVQSHVHLCQTLARGRADDLELLDWLRQIVWPYEAALDEKAMGAAARLACAELLLGGTTAVLDMGSVHHTDAIFAAVRDAGLRATIGKAMMDAPDPQIPPGLRESTRASLDESQALAARWHGLANGRLRYAYAPRFLLSCTDELLRGVAELSRGSEHRVHTHASENKGEIELVRARTGRDNIASLDALGLTGDHVGVAHCVHVGDGERSLLARTGTHVLHCPSSNLKLASGIAPVPELLAAGVKVSLGADGAPCNNNLDAFVELRLAALIHKPRVGASGMTALAALELATLGGARALGLESRIGSLEVGKRADLIVVDARAPHATPAPDPISTIVYAAQSRDVRDVIVDGRVLVRGRRLTSLTGLDADQVLADARAQAARVASRAG